VVVVPQPPPPGFKRGPGRPRTNWRSTFNKDLLGMGITWEEVEVAAQNRSEWRRSVAQCIHLHVGWIKVKVKEVPLILFLLLQSTAQSLIWRSTGRATVPTRCRSVDILAFLNAGTESES